jgi:microcystin-dependent protein
LPIETFGSIAELNPSFPAPSDGIVQGDDHIRGIKAAIKATFPNITNPLTATGAQLNAAAALVDDGMTKLADTGAHFKTNIRDGSENPSAGKVVVTAQDGSAVKQTVVEVTGPDKKTKLNGPLQVVGGVQVSGAITGPGSVPIGGSIKWFSNTLPSDPGWAWENGQKVNVSDNPVLASIWPDRITDGGTKIQLPDSREVVPIGNSTMGGTAPRGIISHISVGALTTIGGWFGAALQALTTGQLPKHTPSGNVTLSGNKNIPDAGSTGVVAGGSFLTSFNNGTGIDINLGASPYSASFTGNQIGNDEAHNNVQPSAVVNWIIRIG